MAPMSNTQIPDDVQRVFTDVGMSRSSLLQKNKPLASSWRAPGRGSVTKLRREDK
ncbi:hypothetical protein Hanom_Chr12g01103971 [Helianthus anomalus]